MPVELGMARKRSSNQNLKEAPVEVATRHIWAAAVASARLVQNWLDLTEVRRLNGSIEYRCRVVSRQEGGECRTVRHELRCCTAVRHGLRYRTARYGLLKMVPYAVALVRAW